MDNKKQSLYKSVIIKTNIEDDTTFNRLVELQKLLKNESALKELFIKTGKETKENVEKQCNEIYKKKIEVLNILQKLNNKEAIDNGDNNNNNANNNNFSIIGNLKQYILIENNYDYLSDLNTYIPNLLNSLWENPKLIANLLINADKIDTQKYLAPLICNNFYENILSSNFIEDPLMYIIYLLLDNEINNIKDIKDSNSFLNNTNCSYLLGQLIEKKDVKDFFKIILENIIEDIGTNKFIFDVKQIDENQRKQRKTLTKKIFEKNDISKTDTMNARAKRKSEHTISAAKLNNNSRTISSLTLNEQNEVERNKIIKENSDYQYFSSTYLVNITIQDLEQRIKNTDNNSLKDYYKYLISSKDNNSEVCSQRNFIDSVYESKDGEVVLFLYLQDFLKVTEFIDKLFKNLIYNFRIIPYAIRCICKIIYKLVLNKFPDANTIEQNLLISKFFFKILLEPILLNLDVKALINNFILSNNIKANLKTINDILLKFTSFKFYKISSMTGGSNNYTPFNIFFLENIPNVFKFYEKIIKVKLPHFIDELLNEYISIEDYHFNYFKENPNEVLFHKSMLLNIDEFYAIFKNLVNNKEKLFNFDKDKQEKKGIFNKLFKGDKDKNKENEQNNKNVNNSMDSNTKSILKAIDKIKSSDNMDTLKELLKHKEYTTIQREKISEGIFSKKKVIIEEKIQNIQYFHVSTLLFNDKYEKIFALEQKNPYYHIKEIKDLKNKELIKQNNIIKAKNFISSILYNYRMLVKTDFIEGTTNGTNDILKELKFFMKTSNFLIDGNIPSEWYVSSLLECLKKLPNEYKENDYEKLFNELKVELIESINLYNFQNMSIFIDKMKYAKRNKIYFDKMKEIYTDIELNKKVIKVIENAQLNINIYYKFTDKKRELNIYKEGLKEKQLDFLDSFTFKENNDKGKLCKTIEQFTKYFPNLNKRISFEGQIEDVNEINIFKIQEEIELPKKLKSFFGIITDYLKERVTNERELNLINEKIYDYVMSKIFNKIYPKQKHVLDDQILQKACMLSWIEPQNIIENKTNYDFELILPDINKYFNYIKIQKSPRRKLMYLDNIFSSINRLCKFSSGSKEIGVDDQINVLTYCFIKAKPIRIYTDCKFMELYIGKKKNKNEDNYLSQMLVVCDFITKIDAKSIKMDEEEFNQKCQVSFKDYMENYYEE